MLSIFAYAFNAIAPILLLVFIGYYLRQKNIFKPDFFKQANRFTFHYGFPALMFTNIYSLGGLHDINLKLAAHLMVSIITITLISIILANLLTNVRNRKGVLIQAGFRSNFAVIGLPLAEGLLGTQAAAVAASMQIPIVIYFNFFSVLVLAIYSDESEFNISKVCRNIITNPMIQGLAAGTIALVIREFIPHTADGSLVFSIKGTLPWIYTTLNYLGRIATPMALITLGGQFSFSDVPTVKKELVAGTAMRLVMAPAIGFGMAFIAMRLGLLDLTPVAVAVMIAAYGSPIATSSAVMASEMHADDILAGQIVVWTSIFSMLTVFVLIVLFRSTGML